MSEGENREVEQAEKTVTSIRINYTRVRVGEEREFQMILPRGEKDRRPNVKGTITEIRRLQDSESRKYDWILVVGGAELYKSDISKVVGRFWNRP